MDNLISHPYTILLARLVLGVVFLVSGLGKALERQRTISTVIAYQVLPEALARVYAVLLPWVELSLAWLLLVGLFTRLAALALGLLLLSFAIAVSANLARGRRMDCGCFGRAGRERLSWRTLARIVVLLSLSAIVAAKDMGDYTLTGLSKSGSQLAQSPSLLGFLPVLMLATFAYLGYRLLDEAVRMFLDHRQLKGEVMPGHADTETFLLQRGGEAS
ncbi:MAG: MauE/DoxX family redox-associated membrane protein [Chloroflexota bacterium]